MQPVTPSSADVDVTFRVLDSTTFLPYESLSAATPGLALWYQKGAAGSVTAITEGDHTNLTDAHSDGKLKHIDDGWYRLSLPDAAVPTAEHEVTTFGGTATGYVILGGAIVGKPIEVVSGSLVAASVSGAVGSVTGAVGSVTGAVGSVTGNVGGNVTGSVGSVATDGITAASIATGAVDAAALAADAVAEIQSGLATAASVAALPSVADFWSGITATAAGFIADHTLRRSWASAAISANGDALSFRSLLGAVAKLVNRVGISGATLTVYQDDDTTALGTQTVTSDAAAEPITGANTV
jgi:hypothetical protein